MNPGLKPVLIVDDEPQLLRALSINFKARHYSVATAANGCAALRAATQRPPCAVLLDVELPDMSGIKVIHSLRTWSPVPILVLSGRTGATDKVTALDAGADDYVTKPFCMDELFARLRAVLRRPPALEGRTTVRLGHYTVDFTACTIHSRVDHDRAPHLTPTEWRVLTALARTPGRLVTSRELLRTVWGPGNENRTNYLRIYLATLRRKLEAEPSHPRHLITEPGLGYRFEP